MLGPHQAHFILQESIPITPLFGITKFNSLFILKHFKKQKEKWKRLAEEKMATNFIENEILEPKKMLRMKNGRVRIILKKKLKSGKLFEEWDLEKIFSKLQIVRWEMARGPKVKSCTRTWGATDTSLQSWWLQLSFSSFYNSDNPLFKQKAARFHSTSYKGSFH